MTNFANLCVICGTRPGMTSAQLRREGVGRDFSDQCLPCHTEAGFENQHSDYAHEAIAAGDVEGLDEENLASIKKDMGACWICNPELNEAAKAYVPRSGTSRAGMRITVPIRATGRDKAAAVKAQIPAGYKVTISSKEGFTTLRAKGALNITLIWDAARGAFVSGTAQATNGTAKKVRNASEALRAMGV